MRENVFHKIYAEKYFASMHFNLTNNHSDAIASIKVQKYTVLLVAIIMLIRRFVDKFDYRRALVFARISSVLWHNEMYNARTRVNNDSPRAASVVLSMHW